MTSATPGTTTSRGKDTKKRTIHPEKNKTIATTTTTTTTTTSPSTTSSDNNSLWSVCGVDTPSASECCGESMLSKVTTLFGAGAVTDEETPPSSEREEDPDDSEAAAAAAVETAVPPEDGAKGSAAKKPTKPKKKKSTISEKSNGDAAIHKSPKKKKSIKKNSKDGEGNEDQSPKKKTRSPKPKKKRDSLKTTTSCEEEPLDSPAASSLNSATSDHDDKEEDTLDEDDVDAMLNNLEIPDFQMSMDDLDDQADDNSIDTKKPWETVDWKQRMTREEVYSKRYRPQRAEAKELQVMAEVLGLSKSTDLFKRMSVSIGMGSRATEDSHKLFFGKHSILLSIIPVQWDGNQCDLLLLTDGFVLKYRRTSNSFNPLEKRYESCQLWDSVEFCERSSPFAVTIQINPSTRYEMEAVADGENLDTIFKRLEHVITQYDMHASSTSSDRTDVLGWQYLRVHKPAFTAAVANDPKLLPSSGKSEAVSRLINELDTYNRYAPLHYAMLQEDCNPELIKALLKAGADPNLLDGDERSSMYYAERNELPEEVMDLLQGGGGQKSKLAEMEMRGALFSGVEAAKQKVEQRREREQAVKDQKAAEAMAKAEGAQNEMSKAMSALIERGEKIELMDQKTKDLEAEAKTFGDLAARLKDEVKNKKWYQL